MRQNLTNIKEVNIEDVEHFYVVGSTTKEGLIEGRSNVKLDLKKVEGGEGGDTQSGGSFNIDDIILADDLLEKCQALGIDFDESAETDWAFSDICVQDSCGVLQFAFEQSTLTESSASSLLVFSGDSAGIYCASSSGFPAQIIHIPVRGGESYEISYSGGKYTVLHKGDFA